MRRTVFSIAVGVGASLGLGACHDTGASAKDGSVRQVEGASSEPPEPKSPAVVNQEPEVVASAPPAAPATLPAELPIGVPEDVPLDGDRKLRVAHARADNRHALVYLHGMCGDSQGADGWADLAVARGTLIVVRADVPCPDRPGYKWPAEPEAIEARIVRALEEVKRLRGGLLDVERATLIGYSQGAHRAELLAARYPDRYRKLVLGGPPSAAVPANLKAAERVAVLGGELEDSSHMRKGAADLEKAGIESRFFLLPKTHHGGYGPEGHRVMEDVFAWLWGEPKPAR